MTETWDPGSLDSVACAPGGARWTLVVGRGSTTTPRFRRQRLQEGYAELLGTYQSRG